MTEFANCHVLSFASTNWARLASHDRAKLLKELAPLFSVTYGRFEQAQYDHFASQPTTAGLTDNIRSHLFLAATPEGFSAAKAQKEMEDYANSYQG